MLQRPSNPPGGSNPASPARAAETARRADARQDAREVDSRERAGRFRAALEQRTQHDDKIEARTAHADVEDVRAGERSRDRAAAAEVLGRMGLDGDGDRPIERPAASDSQVAGAGQSAPPANGAGAAAAPDQAPANEVGPEIAAIEDAIEKVMGEGTEVQPAAPAEALAIPAAVPWARPEGPARPEAPRQLPGPPPGAEVYHQLLMGKGPAGAEARLTITQGPLAGLQIHLTNGPRGVQAAVLTPGGSSRQTLLSAMDQVAQRLRQKGHDLDLKLGPGDTGGLPPRRG